MFTDAEDWVARFRKTGCKGQIDVVKMWPKEGEPLSPECEAIWVEIRGSENRDKWRQVYDFVVSEVGPIRPERGWENF